MDALKIVRESFPDIVLSIVGDGPLREDLEIRSASLGLDRNVEFHGAVTQDKLPTYYSRATIAIIPSVVAKSGDQEGLGLVTVEALGCGCAVIASDLPAIRDVITSGENGLLVKPADSNALAEAITKLLHNEPQLKEFRNAARASVMEKFDWSVVADRYAALLSSLPTTHV